MERRGEGGRRAQRDGDARESGTHSTTHKTNTRGVLRGWGGAGTVCGSHHTPAGNSQRRHKAKRAVRMRTAGNGCGGMWGRGVRRKGMGLGGPAARPRGAAVRLPGKERKARLAGCEGRAVRALQGGKGVFVGLFVLGLCALRLLDTCVPSLSSCCVALTRGVLCARASRRCVLKCDVSGWTTHPRATACMRLVCCVCACVCSPWPPRAAHKTSPRF